MGDKLKGLDTKNLSKGELFIIADLNGNG